MEILHLYGKTLQGFRFKKRQQTVYAGRLNDLASQIAVKARYRN